VRLYPKPARKGGPPVLIGSKDKNALRWVAQWGDGWCPILLSPDQMRVELAKLRDECTKAGRDYATLDLTIMRTLRGNRTEVQAGLHQYEDLGIHRFVLMMIANRLGPDNYATEVERQAALYV
jgi:alkanesulfonate monooxygenase SsuD/methylene tetrahydromethanopterin reductase-like flavin-dependent oxidoreductase (luciferase family)